MEPRQAQQIKYTYSNPINLIKRRNGQGYKKKATSTAIAANKTKMAGKVTINNKTRTKEIASDCIEHVAKNEKEK